MKYFILLFLVVVTIGSANAEEVTVDVQLCRELINHTPRNDVTYRAGADPVAPADLPAGQDYNFLTQNIREIPITIDLADDLLLDTTGLEMPYDLPPVQLRPDGRVFWNGQDITQTVHYRCEEQGKTVPLVIRPTGGL